MARLPHNPSELSPQLPTTLSRQLRGRLMFSGDALLRLSLRYGLLIFYVATVYVVVLDFGGVTNGHMAVPWWLDPIGLLIIVQPSHHCTLSYGTASTSRSTASTNTRAS